MNIQREEIDPNSLRSFYKSEEHKKLLESSEYHIPAEILSRVGSLLQNAKRPVILV